MFFFVFSYDFILISIKKFVDSYSMQIFSYVDSNISNSQASRITLDSLLKSQRPHRVKRNNYKPVLVGTNSVATSIANPLASFSINSKNFIDALSGVISKVKYVFLVISVLYVLALFVPYFMANIQFSIKPLEMDVISETESVYF